MKKLQKVILVIHGMRSGKLNETLLHFTKRLFKETDLDYDIAFLESKTKTLSDCIRHNVQNGYQQIQMIPLLLLTASHYFEDIIAIRDEWQSNHPEIEIQIAQPLGTHPAMKDWISEKIENCSSQINDKTAIVILAHGNKRFEEPDIALTQITQELTAQYHACFPAMVYGSLNFKQILPPLAQAYKRLIIIPYFFYDGFLVNRTKQQISEMHLDCEIHFTPAIHFHPILKKVILARLHELEEGACVSGTT